ncbi:hypothetical protein OHD55_18065 [Escherichia coli]|nr:hypothetical protein [Escherichia coli]
MDIYTGFLFYTNHFDALALPEEDRRIAVLGGALTSPQLKSITPACTVR